MALTYLHISWNEVTPTSEEVFVNYNVYKRKSGEVFWTKIANILGVETTDYDDYLVEWDQDYEYTVTWVADIAGALVESNRATAVADSVTPTLKEATLHVVDDPTVFADLIQQSVQVDETLDVEYLQAWSREKPTPHIGNSQFASISVNTREFWSSNKAMWDDLVKVLRAQQETGSVLCLKHREEMYIVTMNSGTRSDSRPIQYGAAISLQEVHYDESVS